MERLFLQVILLTATLLAQSCGDDLFEDDMPHPTEIPETHRSSPFVLPTRAISSETDFYGTISELVENKVPINIVNVEHKKYPYLRYYSTGTSVQTTDTENEFCRWILTAPIGVTRERAVYCAARFSEDNIFAIVPKQPLSKTSTPAILKKMKRPTMGLEFTGTLFSVKGTKHYEFVHQSPDMDAVPPAYKQLLLQCETNYGKNVVYQNNVTTLGYWDISPAGKYDVINIQYIETELDGSVPKIEAGRSTTINNPTDATVSHKIMLSEKTTVSSIIREPEEVVIQTVGQVSEPKYDTNGKLTSDSSESVGTMEFGSSTSYEKTIGDELTVTVPPHTSINVEVQRQTYDVTATYIATVVSQIYGKKFRIKGTYNGRIFTRIIVNVKNVNDGSIIKTETIDKVISQ